MCMIGGILAGTCSRQINAFMMVTMEIYLYMCHNIVTNILLWLNKCFGHKGGNGA